jgi:hypothetical protein
MAAADRERMEAVAIRYMEDWSSGCADKARLQVGGGSEEMLLGEAAASMCQARPLQEYLAPGLVFHGDGLIYPQVRALAPRSCWQSSQAPALLPATVPHQGLNSQPCTCCRP